MPEPNKTWNVGMFVRNWRGMYDSLMMMRNYIAQKAWLFHLGHTPDLSAFGAMNTFDVALCHCFEVAMKSLVAMYGPVPKGREGHRIEKMFTKVPREDRIILQSFWEKIPPRLEVETPDFSDAVKGIDGGFMAQRYAPWEELDPESAARKLAAPVEWMWLFMVTSYAVTTVFALRMMRKDDTGRIRGMAVECFEEDPSIPVSVVGASDGEDARVGTAVVLCVIDTPMGSTVPLMIDLSLKPSIRIRQTGEFVPRT